MPGLNSNLGSGVRRASMIVLVGSAAGLGVNLLLTPLISRIFTPETFGMFATITSVTSLFVGVSTLRLEVRSQQVATRAEANGLLRLGLFTSVIWAMAISIVTLPIVLLSDISVWWIACGPLAAVASLQLLGSAALIRRGNYKALAVSNFVHGASVGLTQVILGLLSGQVWALLAGFAAGRLVWLKALRRIRRPKLEPMQLWVSSWRFAIISGGSAFINSCAGQLPILLCSWLYGNAAAGLLAMAIRLLVAPLAVVAEAAASASLGEVGKMVRNRDPAASRVVRRGMRDLLLIGAVPCLTAAIVGSWLVPRILGSEWSQSGTIVAILAFGTLAQFVGSPASQLLNITNSSGWLLRWDIGRFVLIAMSFVVTHFIGGGLIAAVAMYSLAMVLLYGTLLVLAIGAIRRFYA